MTISDCTERVRLRLELLREMARAKAQEGHGDDVEVIAHGFDQVLTDCLDDLDALTRLDSRAMNAEIPEEPAPAEKGGAR